MREQAMEMAYPAPLPPLLPPPPLPSSSSSSSSSAERKRMMVKVMKEEGGSSSARNRSRLANNRSNGGGGENFSMSSNSTISSFHGTRFLLSSTNNSNHHNEVINDMTAATSAAPTTTIPPPPLISTIASGILPTSGGGSRTSMMPMKGAMNNGRHDAPPPFSLPPPPLPPIQIRSKSSNNNSSQGQGAIAFPATATATEPSKEYEEEEALPQWGNRKRSRCSRFEPSSVSKHTAAGPSAAKSINQSASAEKSLNGEEILPTSQSAKLRGHGGAPSKHMPHSMKPDNHHHPNHSPALPRNGMMHKIGNGSMGENGRGAVIGVDPEASRPTRRPPPATERKLVSTVAHHDSSYNHSKQRTRASEQLEEEDEEEEEDPDTDTDQKKPKSRKSKERERRREKEREREKISGGSCALKCEQQAAPTTCVPPRVDVQTLEWPRIVLALSRKEKEEDFFVFKGTTKLSQRPKKRPKVVEKALLYCVPGNWLGDICRGRYDVREKRSTKKKPRGLKAMESMESDSE